MSGEPNTIRLLSELRSRLIHFLIVLFITFAILLYFANHLYTWLALPLLKFLPQGHLIATEIVSPFMVPLKLTFFISMLLAAPYFLYQLWSFVSPALYGHEKRFVWSFVSMSACLFYLGIAFAYFIIFPMLFHFFANTAPEGVILTPDIGEYLDFTVKLLLIFGLLFEIPVVMVFLVKAGLVSHSRWIKLRPFALLAAFILGMLLAPPDVLSQTILAIPIWALYELGIQLSKFFLEKE